jgi:four helix bundle protein
MWQTARTQILSYATGVAGVVFAHRPVHRGRIARHFHESTFGTRRAGPCGVRPDVEALQKRTRAFANAVIQLCDKLPPSRAGFKISDQLLDSSSSTDSNYRAACRARSRKEFIAVLGKAIEECDESLGWLEMLVENRLAPEEEAKALVKEADELVAIFVKSRKTAERNYENELSRERAARRRKSRLSGAKSERFTGDE